MNCFLSYKRLSYNKHHFEKTGPYMRHYKSYFNKVTKIYCTADDFRKEFAKVQEKYMLEDKNHSHQNKPNRINDAEFMAILFHLIGFRRFKHYYQEYVCKHLTCLFPKRLPYNRFLGIGEGSPVAVDRFNQRSIVGYLYRNQLCGFHSATCMP